MIAIHKEAMLRVKDPAKKGQWKQQELRGVDPDNDHYTNNRALQDYLYHEEYPLSQQKLDSVFKAEIKDNYTNLDYTFLIIDSAAYQTASIDIEPKRLNRLLTYKETVRIRNVAPEYVTLTVSSPYLIIFGKMLIPLVGTLILAVVGVYGLIFQINLIRRQVKIATLRQEFSDAMVHNMTTPAMTIIIAVKALRSEKIDGNPQKKERYHNTIEEAGKQIHNISNKVLEIAGFEEQSLTLSKEQINLTDLLNG